MVFGGDSCSRGRKFTLNRELFQPYGKTTFELLHNQLKQKSLFLYFNASVFNSLALDLSWLRKLSKLMCTLLVLGMGVLNFTGYYW